MPTLGRKIEPWQTLDGESWRLSLFEIAHDVGA